MFWRSNVNGNQSDYEPAGPLLSSAELSFYQVASAAVGKSAMLLSKVRMVNVIKPRSGLADARWRKLFEPLAQKHLDFVLIDVESLETLCVLEFESSTQLNEERMKRNEFVQEVCDAAGVPRIMIDARGGFDINGIREQLAFLWAKDGDSVVSEVSGPASALSDVVAEATTDTTSEVDVQQPVPSVQSGAADIQEQSSSQVQLDQSFEANTDTESDDVLTIGGSQADAETEIVSLSVSMDAPDVLEVNAAINTAPEDPIPPASDKAKSPFDLQTDNAVPETVEAAVAPATEETTRPLGASVDTPDVPESAKAEVVQQPEKSVITSTSVIQKSAVTRTTAKTVQKPKVKAPDCPKCGSPLARRQPKSGKLAGQLIWVCSTYPDCRYLAPLKAHKMIKIG